MKPMTERDEKGRLTHVRLSDGTERWYDYDADGHVTHVRWGGGDERWYDYDADGNIAHTRLSNGTEFWYDADGNITHERLTTRPRALSRRALSTLNRKDLK